MITLNRKLSAIKLLLGGNPKYHKNGQGCWVVSIRGTTLHSNSRDLISALVGLLDLVGSAD